MHLYLYMLYLYIIYEVAYKYTYELPKIYFNLDNKLKIKYF